MLYLDGKLPVLHGKYDFAVSSTVHVSLSDTKYTNADKMKALEKCVTIRNIQNIDATYSCDEGAFGRYIYLHLFGDDRFEIQEFEVYAYPGM